MYNLDKLATRYTRRRKTKQKHNTICVGHHYAQLSINNVNKTCWPSKNWRKRRTEHCFYAEFETDITTRNLNTHNWTTQKSKTISNTDLIKHRGELMCSRKQYAVPASYKTPAVLLIYTVR